jgi:hypothetical protein
VNKTRKRTSTADTQRTRPTNKSKWKWAYRRGHKRCGAQSSSCKKHLDAVQLGIRSDEIRNKKYESSEKQMALGGRANDDWRVMVHNVCRRSQPAFQWEARESWRKTGTNSKSCCSSNFSISGECTMCTWEPLLLIVCVYIYYISTTRVGVESKQLCTDPTRKKSGRDRTASTLKKRSSKWNLKTAGYL